MGRDLNWKPSEYEAVVLSLDYDASYVGTSQVKNGTLKSPVRIV